MTSSFVKVIKQAKITFDAVNSQSFKNNFKVLKQLVDKLTVDDINVDREHFALHPYNRPRTAPCTFIDIFDTEDFSMSIFILSDSYTMPLHDHPMMHGILKAISGTIRVKTYTADPANLPNDPLNSQFIKVKAECEKILTPNDPAAVLSPTECNFHEISAINGSAAFFDILSPPYEADMPIYGPRPCSFYKKNTIEGSSNDFVLERINCPKDYYCDTASYQPTENVEREMRSVLDKYS